jgi:4-oxalocrotonate tautomerase
MPHVIVKLLPGRSEDQKTALANAIVENVTSIARCEVDAVSVAFEEVSSEDWTEKVYRPDILGHPDRLYKKPGYGPLG